MRNKKAFEFNFAWFFAIIAGAVILFLAIYFSSSLIKSSSYRINTITAKQLGIIFEPMETGLASAKKASSVRLKEETRIYNECYNSGGFGLQRISLASKQLGKWSKKSADIPITNKYIFSQNIEEGKEIYLFSKPFEMPWKVSEIIFLTTESYCFVDSPEEIAEEIESLNLENIKLGNCSKEDIKVCFSGNCEIKVFYDDGKGFVNKEGESLNYVGSLMYAAIFSSQEIYECNVQRLAKRLLQQALIYDDEARFLTGKCGTANSIALIGASRITSSQNLLALNEIAKEVDRQNEAAECKLW